MEEVDTDGWSGERVLVASALSASSDDDKHTAAGRADAVSRLAYRTGAATSAVVGRAFWCVLAVCAGEDEVGGELQLLDAVLVLVLCSTFCSLAPRPAPRLLPAILHSVTAIWGGYMRVARRVMGLGRCLVGAGRGSRAG